MTHPFHDQLIAAGWSYYGQQGQYRPFGYYCLKTEGLPHCKCNDRSPQVVAEPYNHHYQYPQAPNQWSMELNMAAECANEEWVFLKAPTHQLPPDKWGPQIARLKAAWTAAEGIQ